MQRRRAKSKKCWLPLTTDVCLEAISHQDATLDTEHRTQDTGQNAERGNRGSETRFRRSDSVHGLPGSDRKMMRLMMSAGSHNAVKTKALEFRDVLGF